MTKFFFLMPLILAGILIAGRPGPLLAGAYTATGIGGSTGMITTPTAKTGWDNSDLGFAVGYHFITDNDYSHAPTITVSFMKQAEIGFAFDAQGPRGDDFLFHAKWNFYCAGEAALAAGANIQAVRFNMHDAPEPFGQVYLAFTYLGDFFGMPAQTSILFGKTLGRGYYNGDIDFSMSFDLNLFPDYLQNYLHWISDFANYSYTVDPNGTSHERRGAFNTGFRIVVLKGDERFKLNFDLLVTDFFDEGERSFVIGTMFGYAIL